MVSAGYFLQSCRLLRQYGLTLTQAQVICALGNDLVTSAEIQDKTGLSEGAVMSCLAYLLVTEDIRVVDVRKTACNKRKSRIYRLTASGERMFEGLFALPGQQRVRRIKPHGEDQLVLSFE